MKLELLHISKQYGKKKAVEDMSLVLTNGVWRISGNSKCGKTTLLRLITGSVKPTEGKLFYNERNIFEDYSQYKAVLGYLPQHFKPDKKKNCRGTWSTSFVGSAGQKNSETFKRNETESRNGTGSFK